MPRGRPRKSIAEKLRSGTLQQCRINRLEPVPAPIDSVECLATEEQKVLEGILSGAAPGHFRQGDQVLLASLCATVCRRAVIAKDLADWIGKKDKGEGETAVLKRGQKGGLSPHPGYRLLVNYDTEIRALCSELGLSPTSRASVRAGMQRELDGADHNEFKDFPMPNFANQN